MGIANGEVNPNHPVTREFREQWYKICAILLNKFGLTEVQITSADIDALASSGRANITMRAKGETITLSLVTDREAARLARQEGGLPV
jgi:hypothetical protein